MNSFKKFSEDKLPDRSEFFSSLKDKCISERDYPRAIDVWNVFKINTKRDYYDLYLKTDALLLADVFEKFISTCLYYHGLDPCHYFSSPGLSWDSMLKMTGKNLDLILDTDMHLSIEKGMTHIFQEDMVKQIINTCGVMIAMKKVSPLCIWMQIIYMVGQ